jgi:hypothetical protein
MNRLRLLQLVTVLLYLGPLVAGMAGFGWGQVAAFAAVFLLWQIVMRPLDWPREAARWNDRQLQAAAVARVVLLVVLVAVLFGIGRGIGGVFGHLPRVPPLVPFGLSLVAIPLARLIWDPVQGAEMDRFLDDALRQMKGVSADAAHIAAGTEKADRLLQPLQDLPADTPVATVEDHLRALAPHADPARLREALVARVASGTAARPLRLALALHASDPGMLATLSGQPLMVAWDTIGTDAAPLALFARRMVPALEADAGLWWDLPTADLIAARAAHVAGTEAEAPLMALIAAAERLAQRNQGG